jgi:hypothetical protein
VQAWESTLIDIIKQEMLHLALATNILTAIGAAPHFERRPTCQPSRDGIRPKSR